MTTKIDQHGQPFDPAERARSGVIQLRVFVTNLCPKTVSGDAEHSRLTACLNSIADRLATCDALEAKLARQGQAHAELIQSAAALLLGMRVRAVPIDPLNPDHDDLYRRVVDALTGVAKAEGGAP